MPDEALQHDGPALGQGQPLGDLPRAACTLDVMLEEADATADTRARLGLGHVVEQGSQLEDLAACDTAGEQRGEVCSHLLAETVEDGSALEEGVGACHRPERVLEPGEA